MSKRTVFYSWQSDTPTNSNRSLIEAALKLAIKRIASDWQLDAPLALDRDTLGVPGTPEITSTIFKKIDECAVFVGDLTYVAKSFSTLEKTEKLVSNPNVLLEYGYALKATGADHCVMVLNTHYGPPAELPFNLSHRRYPICYSVSPDSDKQVRRDAKDSLAKELEIALREVFLPTRPIEGDPASFLADWSGLVPEQRLPDMKGNPGFIWDQDGAPKLYLRIMPTKKVREWSPDELCRLMQREPPVTPLGRQHDTMYGTNEFGGITYSFVKQDDVLRLMNFTQAFTYGELWGVDVEYLQHKTIPGHTPAIIADSLTQYLQFLRYQLGMPVPLEFECGLAKVQDFSVGSVGIQASPFVPYHQGQTQLGLPLGSCKETAIMHRGIIDDYSIDVEIVIRALGEKVEKATGLDDPASLLANTKGD